MLLPKVGSFFCWNKEHKYYWPKKFRLDVSSIVACAKKVRFRFRKKKSYVDQMIWASISWRILYGCSNFYYIVVLVYIEKKCSEKIRAHKKWRFAKSWILKLKLDLKFLKPPKFNGEQWIIFIILFDSTSALRFYTLANC